MSLAGLHQSLSDDHPLAVVRELARAEELLQHRRFRLLHLQEQRVLAIPAEHQRDPRARADTPDPDHLTREIGQLELLEQHPPVELERLPIAAQQLVQRLEHLVALLARRELLDRHDQRRLSTIRAFPSTTSVSFENAVMLSFVRAFARFFSVRLTIFGLNCEPNS